MNKLLFITPIDKKSFKKTIGILNNLKYTFKNPKKKSDVKFVNKNYKKFNFLISYASGLIITQNLINHFNPSNIINFHPATPKFRGRDSQHFAAYLREKNFGGTMHYLRSKIDNGKILDVKVFKMKKNSSHYEYHDKALKALNFLLKKNIKKIFANKKFKKNKHKWSKKIYKRTDFLKMLKIPYGIKKKDFDHVYRSFFTHDKLSLYTELHKKKFFITN